MQDIADFYKPESYATNVHLMNEIITPKRLADVDGHMVWYQHIKTPIIVANRCSFSIFFTIEHED